MFSLIPFLIFGGFALLGLGAGFEKQGEELSLVIYQDLVLVSASKLFWVGVIFSGAMLVIIAINDFMDFVQKVFKKDPYKNI